MRNYWLFQVMVEWYPETWRLSVDMGIAAHHYPPGWTNEAPNISRFQEMAEGDRIVAAFKHHRFAGYGTLKSGFYRGGPSLQIRDGARILAFSERFDCDWKVIPFEQDPMYVDCHDLKEEGFKIDLERGRAAKKIDEDSFEAIKACIDEVRAGSRPD